MFWLVGESDLETSHLVGLVALAILLIGLPLGASNCSYFNPAVGYNSSGGNKVEVSNNYGVVRR